ncbi:MAG: GntR family transcriptional regulator [Eubacteriales bacterium]|nr:GntR family transcriptional regulator [Eubacteriales bacterium]MDD3350584.1 GntR family transcriptional regulator [Eubacteriales bacterium]
MFQLDLKSRKSIYEQVVDNIKELVIAGVLNSEDKLPSVRELSKALTVNPNTVQKAYRELEYQGFIYTVSGLGTFVTSPIHSVMDGKKAHELQDNIRRDIKELLYMGMTRAQINELLQELFEERGEGND